LPQTATEQQGQWIMSDGPESSAQERDKPGCYFRNRISLFALSERVCQRRNLKAALITPEIRDLRRRIAELSGEVA